MTLVPPLRGRRKPTKRSRPRHGCPISDPFPCLVFIFFLRQHHVGCLEHRRCGMASCSVENTPSIYGRIHLHGKLATALMPPNCSMSRIIYSSSSPTSRSPPIKSSACLVMQQGLGGSELAGFTLALALALALLCHAGLG